MSGFAYELNATNFPNGLNGPNLDQKLLDQFGSASFKYTSFFDDSLGIYFNDVQLKATVDAFLSTYDPAVLVCPTTSVINLVPIKQAVTIAGMWIRTMIYCYDPVMYPNINSFLVVTSANSNVNTYDVRVYDSTNDNELGTTGNITRINNNEIITVINNLSNIPTSMAQIELQININVTGVGESPTVCLRNASAELAAEVF